MPVKEMLSWRDSLKKHQDNPPWRQITKNSAGEIQVSFEPLKLNTGFILMDKNNGHYESEEAFHEAYMALFGVKSESNLSMLQTTRSQKLIISDGEANLLPSSGDFVQDALSDPKGDIYIEGQLLKPVRGEVMMRKDGFNSSARSSDVSVMASTSLPFTFKGRVGKSGYSGFYHNWYTNVYAFSVNGLSTGRYCTRSGNEQTCFTVTVFADEMKIKNAYKSPKGRVSIESKTKGNVDSMSFHKSDYVWLGFNEDIHALCGQAFIEYNGVTRNGYADYPGNWTAPIVCPRVE